MPDTPDATVGFGLVARALPDAVLALDAEGTVVVACPRSRGVFGEDAVGVPFRDLFEDGDCRGMKGGEGALVAGAWDARRRGAGTWLSVALHPLGPGGAGRADLADGAVALVRPLAEGAVRDRSDLLRGAFDAANNLIVVTDARVYDNPVVLANQHFFEATGYTRDEVLGRNCRFLQTRADGTHDADQPALDRLRAGIAAGRPTRVVVRNYRKSGALFYNELYVSPIHDADGVLTHYVGVQNDVTERVRAEQAAAAHAEVVGAFFEGMPLPMGVVEPVGGGLVHRAANMAAAALFSGAEVVGAELEALGVPEGTRAKWAGAVEQAAAEGAATFEATHPWDTAEGRVLRFTVSPAAGGLFAYVGEDVTAARQLERERRLLAAAVASAAEAIVVTDADLDDGPRILYANEAHTQIFGYDADEIVGRTPRIYQGPRTDRAVLDRVRAALEAGETVRAEAVNYRRDGTPFLLEWEIAPVRDADGQVVNFVGTQRDVTERRRLEREVLDVSAHERERMARDLHDGLGQVLTGASLTVQALANRLAAADPATADFAAFAEDARTARALVDRALSDARATARGLLPAVADRDGLATALARLAGDVGQAYGVACTFQAAEPVGARTVEAAGHLLRIVQEAVANAARHGRARTIEIALAADGDGWAVLTVTDDGSGLPPGAQASGGGLGMQTMRYRAERVGGAFAIGPGPEGGTRATVRFPTEPR